MQNIGRKTLFFLEQAQQQVLSSDVFMAQALSFFSAIGQNALALLTQRKIDRGGYPLALRASGVNLRPNRFGCATANLEHARP